MISAADNPLVAGGAPQSAQKAIRIRVLRAFLIRMVPQAIGTVLEVPRALGSELISANKAERTDDPVSEAAKPAKAPDVAPAPKAPAAPKKEA